MRARAQHGVAADRTGPAVDFQEFTQVEIEQSVPRRFEQQVRRYPDRLAVESRGERLSYVELNVAANRVSHSILSLRGPGEESVALVFQTGLRAIVAIMGVLKAGKRYVPLYPTNPRTRNAHILNDSEAGLVVADNNNVALALELAGERLPLLNVDELDPSLSVEGPNLDIPPDSHTWIIYTSGSTGDPKGVVQTHRNVLHYVMNYTNYFRIRPDDRLTMLFSWTVNGAAHDMFAALLNGAALFCYDVREEGVAGLAAWLTRQRITIYCSVPTVFRHFVAGLSAGESFPDVRLVRFIGEPLYKRDVEAARPFFSDGCIFVNRLGSTETGSILLYLFDKDGDIEGHHAPVGYEVEGNRVFLLNESGDPVVAGEVGEIAVRSRYLFPGYWRKPERTEDAFVSDPEGGGEGGGERVYGMGDLGEIRADGSIVCLGRTDFQVKIKGTRIETAEIEMALLDLDDVKEAVVMGRGEQGEQRLVAYIVPDGPSRPTVTALRGTLSDRLPVDMIPSAFVTIDALPLAPNRKVDRRALPEPGTARPELDNSYTPPRNPVEVAVADIWVEVLGIDRIGTDDRFLELGSDSLLASRVISRVVSAFGVDVSQRQLFEASTVADMAVAITERRGEEEVPGGVERMLSEVEGLSDTQARQMLDDPGSA